MDKIQTENENQILWLFVTTVSQGKCRCGYSPNINGTPCDACMAVQLLTERHLSEASTRPDKPCEIHHLIKSNDGSWLCDICGKKLSGG